MTKQMITYSGSLRGHTAISKADNISEVTSSPFLADLQKRTDNYWQNDCPLGRGRGRGRLGLEKQRGSEKAGSIPNLPFPSLHYLHRKVKM